MAQLKVCAKLFGVKTGDDVALISLVAQLCDARAERANLVDPSDENLPDRRTIVADYVQGMGEKGSPPRDIALRSAIAVHLSILRGAESMLQDASVLHTDAKYADAFLLACESRDQLDLCTAQLREDQCAIVRSPAVEKTYRCWELLCRKIAGQVRSNSRNPADRTTKTSDILSLATIHADRGDSLVKVDALLVRAGWQPSHRSDRAASLREASRLFAAEYRDTSWRAANLGERNAGDYTEKVARALQAAHEYDLEAANFAGEVHIGVTCKTPDDAVMIDNGRPFFSVVVRA